MKKRIIAWILLAGFVLLLLNLTVIRFYWQLSMIVYVIIVFAFVLTNGRLFAAQDDDGRENPYNSGNNDAGGDDDSVGEKKEE